MPKDKCSRYCTRKRLIVVAIATCFSSGLAWANPSGHQVVNGSANIAQAGKLLTVTNSNGAIINWNTFSIGASETTRFNQTSATSSVLNRVIANDPSVLLGTLSSNGSVWLVNPAGIVVGQGARIDVAGFIASTLNVRNEDFLAGRLNFGAPPNAGSIRNHGQISTPSGGSVFLIAPEVENRGIINAPGGEVILAAGQTVQLIDTGTPGVKVEISGTEGNATNLGEIAAEAGRIGIAGVLVKNSGTVNASSIVREGGRIFLKATKTIDLTGTNAISADGTKGGQIVAKTEENGQISGELVARGELSARGDGSTGSGGFIETSAAQVDIRDLTVHTNGGQWLIDPVDVTIQTGGATTVPSTGGKASPGTQPSTVDVASLQTALANGNNVTIDTTGGAGGNGDITVASPINEAAGSGGALALKADNDINVNAGIGTAGTRFNHDLKLAAGNSIGINSPIYLNGNTLAATAPTTIALDAIVDVGAGTVTLNSTGAVTQSAAIAAGVLELLGTGGVHTLTDAGNQVGEVRMNTGSVILMNNGATVVNGFPAPGPGQERVLTAATPVPGERLGASIAVHGDVRVIGAPGLQLADQGAAYVYRWNGSAWVFEAKLTVPGTLNFGYSVAVEGTHMVVGAPETTDGVSRAGAAYPFAWDGSSWVAGTKLSFSNKVFESAFGSAVAIDNGRLVVGGLGRTSEGGFWTGKIWFYDLVSGAWVEQGNARQSDPQSNDYFGGNLDISGDRLIVGAGNGPSSGTPGKAYIFEFNPGTRVWSETHKLTQPAGVTADYFGSNVSISGELAGVGSARADPSGQADAGSLYVFRHTGGSWVADPQVLLPSDAAAGDMFGYAARVRDGVIVASSPKADVSGQVDAGAGYVFKYNGSNWVQDSKVAAATPVASDWLGASAALANQRLFFGALYADPGGQSAAGAAYAYDPVVAGSTLSGALTIASTGALTQKGAISTGGAINYSSLSNVVISAALSAGANVLLNADSDGLNGGAISMVPGSSIASNGGNITLGGGTALNGSGDAVGNASYVNGIMLDSATLDAGGGNIALNGKGYAGTTEANGVYVTGTSAMDTSHIKTVGTGTISLNGTGGAAGSSDYNNGIRIGSYATVNSVDGQIVLTGQGGASTGSHNMGVYVHNDAVIDASGTGAIKLDGTGGSSGTMGGSNRGVRVSSGASLTTVSGKIDVLGAGAWDGDGVQIAEDSTVQSTSGVITIDGTSGDGAGSDYGVYISTSGGPTGSHVQIGSGGNIIINGTSTATSGWSNRGVSIGTDAQITGSSAISITGQGAGSTTSNYGIYVHNSATIAASGSGTIDLDGTAGEGTNTNNGVYIADAGTALSAVDGSIAITGTGAGSGFDNRGIYISDGAIVTGTGAAGVTLDGTGSANGTNDNYGVYIKNAGTEVSSLNGAVSIAGHGGHSSGSYNIGVYVRDSAAIKATGLGTITLNGTAGAGTDWNSGVLLSSAASLSSASTSSTGGDISITGQGDGSGVGNYGVYIHNGATVSTAVGNNYGAIDVLGVGSANGTVSPTDPNSGVRVSASGGATRIDGYWDDISISGVAGVGGNGLEIVSGAVVQTEWGGILLAGDSLHLDGGITAGTGNRWLIYSTDPANDVLGTVVYDFKQYNAPYATVAAAAGNGLLYSAAPVLTPAITGAVTKVYDGTTAAPLSASFSISGAIAGDTLVYSNPSSALYDTRNAGSAKTVTASGYALTAATSSGGKPVYGYQLPASVSAAIGTITTAPLTPSVSASNKVYDATAVASVSGSLGGVVAGDSVSLLSAMAEFNDKNVGNAKLVTASGLSISGADAGNYALVGASATAVADIIRRPLSNWIGGTRGDWSVAANWDALPDLSNVLGVSIPVGTEITYDAAAGNTNLATLSAAGLVLAGGSLNIADSLLINSGFRQTVGTLTFGSGASADITQASGNLALPGATLDSLTLAAPAGAITQGGAIVANHLKTQSQTGTALNNAGNQIASFSASNAGSGDVTLTNTGTLSIESIFNGNGNIVIDNTGAVTTVGSVSAPNGLLVGINAHSPLTIGAGGVSSGGNIVLSAGQTAGAGDTLMLNGPVASSGSTGTIELSAGDDLVQNSNVTASGGAVSASSQTGNISMGLGASTSSGGGSISYSASSGNIVLTSLNAGTGAIALKAGKSITPAPGFTGTNLIGGRTVIVAGADLKLRTQVRELDVNVGGHFSITDALSGSVITDAPSTVPGLEQIVNTIKNSTDGDTKLTGLASLPTTPSGGSDTKLLGKSTDTIGGTKGSFGGDSDSGDGVSSDDKKNGEEDSSSKKEDAKSDQKRVPTCS